MGTSKIYDSPKWHGVNTAVSNAASSGSSSKQKISAAVGAFAKGYKGYLTSGTISPGSLGGGSTRGGKKITSGSGGTARLRTATSGARLAHFINTVGKSGIDAALREFDLSDLHDKPLEEFLDLVAERLSAEGGLLDDDSFNRAMAETVNELAGEANSVDELDTLLTRGNINIEAVLQIYYANILAANFEQKEYSTVRGKISRENTQEFFARAREVIRAIVREELSRERDLAKIDWNNEEGQRMADEINQEVLDILIP